MKSYYVVTVDDKDRVMGKKIEVERLEGDLLMWSCFW
jgi:hypothetical protein